MPTDADVNRALTAAMKAIGRDDDPELESEINFAVALAASEFEGDDFLRACAVCIKDIVAAFHHDRGEYLSRIVFLSEYCREIPAAEPVLRRSIHDALDRLPPTEAAAIRAVYLDGLTRDRAAYELGITPQQLSRRLDVAVQRLRHCRNFQSILKVLKTEKPRLFFGK